MTVANNRHQFVTKESPNIKYFECIKCGCCFDEIAMRDFENSECSVSIATPYDAHETDDYDQPMHDGPLNKG